MKHADKIVNPIVVFESNYQKVPATGVRKAMTKKKRRKKLALLFALHANASRISYQIYLEIRRAKI